MLFNASKSDQRTILSIKLKLYYISHWNWHLKSTIGLTDSTQLLWRKLRCCWISRGWSGTSSSNKQPCSKIESTSLNAEFVQHSSRMACISYYIKQTTVWSQWQTIYRASSPVQNEDLKSTSTTQLDKCSNNVSLSLHRLILGAAALVQFNASSPGTQRDNCSGKHPHVLDCLLLYHSDWLSAASYRIIQWGLLPIAGLLIEQYTAIERTSDV